MNKTIKKFLQFILFLSVGLGILFLVYQKQNANYAQECIKNGTSLVECSLLDKVILDFQSTNIFWLAMVTLVFLLSNFSRTLRWNILLKPLGEKMSFLNGFFAIMIGYFANLGLPRVGEVIRASTLSKYENIPTEKVFGTIVIDRLVDVLSILIVTFIALLLEFDKIWGFFQPYINKDGVLSKLVIVGFLSLGIILSIYFLSKRSNKESTNPIVQKFKLKLQGFIVGVQSISKIENLGLFVFHSIFIWTMYLLMPYFCFKAFTPTADLPFMAAFIAFIFGAWGIVIPSPGGMGTYHFLTVVALALYGVNGNNAFSYANIHFFTVQIISIIFMGIIGLILLPIINKSSQLK